MEQMLADSREIYLDLLKRALTNTIYEDPAYLPEWDSAKGVLVYKSQPYDFDKRKMGYDVPTVAHTMIGWSRLESLQALMNRVLADGIPGDFIETGVWRGGACIFMRGFLKAQATTDRTVWVADSFSGFPESERAPHPFDRKIALDKSEADHRGVPADTVREYFGRYNLLDDNVRFLEGWFKDTLPDAPIDRLALMRLDGDLYESTMDSLTNLYHKLSLGGFVIIDDFGWPGCLDAVKEFRRERQIEDKIRLDRRVSESGHYAYWQKTK